MKRGLKRNGLQVKKNACYFEIHDLFLPHPTPNVTYLSPPCLLKGSTSSRVKTFPRSQRSCLHYSQRSEVDGFCGGWQPSLSKRPSWSLISQVAPTWNLNLYTVVVMGGRQRSEMTKSHICTRSVCGLLLHNCEAVQTSVKLILSL